MDSDERKERIKRLLHLTSLNDNHLKYYFTKFPIMGFAKPILPELPNIREYNYHLTLDVKYHESLIKYAKKYNNKVLPVSDESDEILLKYIRSKPNIKIIVIFEDCPIPDYFTSLTNGFIYYVKKINLSNKSLKSLLFQLYADRSELKFTNDIDILIKNNINHNDNISLTILIFEPKTTLFRFITDKFCVVNQSFYEAIQFSMIFLNNNSLLFLENQLLDKFIDKSMAKSRLLLLSTRNWIYSTLSLIEANNIILLGSSILYIHGIRNINDIDLFYLPPNNIISTEINDKLIDESNRFPFIDAAIPNTIRWKKYWDNWEIEYANIIGANNFAEIINNPKYHFTYLGMKFMLLDGDVKRRYIRARPQSIIDIIAINKMLNKMYLIPKIPDIMTLYIHLDNDDLDEPDDEVIIKKYNKQLADAFDIIINRELEEIKYSFNCDKNKFFNTILFKLKKYYPFIDIPESKLRKILKV